LRIGAQRQVEGRPAVHREVHAVRPHRERERERHAPAALHHAVVRAHDAGADGVALAAEHGLLAAGERRRPALGLGRGKEAEGAL
ncbi:MAG: hypothetical protein ACK56I_12215, partial [bacterium]